MADKQKIPQKLRQMVRERASGRCEYCLLHEEDMLLPHEVDHIVAEQHGGVTDSENLAWSCYYCNHFKGTNLSSIDPTTKRVASLFHPRSQTWKRHFRLNGPQIEPLTIQGRATAFLLQFNTQSRIDERIALIAIRHYPR
jgi:5-methylcytosine-specific restriction endonuclease McrA